MLYTHGLGIDLPLEITRNAYAGGGSTQVLPIANWRGVFIGATDTAGVKLPCDPYGECAIVWPGTDRAFLDKDRPLAHQNWFGSLAEGMEDASGYVYKRNRYYNPQTGTFTQSDPIGLAGGLNTYGFANGDPVSYDDPYGLCPIPLAFVLLDGPEPGPADAVVGLCWLGTGVLATVAVLTEASHQATPRAARRQAMRDFGIPTSRPPNRRCRTEEGGVQEQFDETDHRGNTTRTTIVEPHRGNPASPNAADRMNHYEAGEAKPAREYGTRRDGTLRTRNNKSKCTYGDDPGTPAH